MKSKLLFLSFLMLLMVTTNYAQSSASVSGIAVQGIARDDNNTALINASVRFAFTIYDKSNSDVVHTEDLTITTDEFGVFSHTIAIPTEKYASFGGKVLWLKIEDDNDVISDEVFKHVPYAIAASNGVPTGSIMPFVGSTAPPGWVLCNGQALGPIEGSENLSLLIGSNVPDLRGMFLRGAETNGDPQYADNAGPQLNDIQPEALKSHTPVVTVAVEGAGKHRHRINKLPMDGGVPEGTNDMQTLTNSSTSNEGWRTLLSTPQNELSPGDELSEAPDHNHPTTVTVNPALDAGLETRPVNYGVNYIIKL